MAELATFARPYAKAAFEHADAQNGFECIAKWSQTLEELSVIINTDKVRDMLKSPAATSSQKATRLIELLASQDSHINNFINTLASNNRLLLLPEISTLFNQFKLRREQQIDVLIQSAYELTDACQRKLGALIKRHFNSEGTIQSEIDSSLIGGFIIHANGSIFDASIKGKLNRLASINENH